MPVIKISPEMCFHACVEILWFSKIHYVCGFLFVCLFVAFQTPVSTTKYANLLVNFKPEVWVL